MTIDWEAFKEHKQYSVRKDNFEKVLEFMKSYYNMINPYDLYDALAEDDIGQMMLEKRDIKGPEGVEDILYKM